MVTVESTGLWQDSKMQQPRLDALLETIQTGNCLSVT